jgi:hypothetical protein
MGKFKQKLNGFKNEPAGDQPVLSFLGRSFRSNFNQGLCIGIWCWPDLDVAEEIPTIKNSRQQR